MTTDIAHLVRLSNLRLQRTLRALARERRQLADLMRRKARLIEELREIKRRQAMGLDKNGRVQRSDALLALSRLKDRMILTGSEIDDAIVERENHVTELRGRWRKAEMRHSVLTEVEAHDDRAAITSRAERADQSVTDTLSARGYGS